MQTENHRPSIDPVDSLREADKVVASMVQNEESFYDEDGKIRAPGARIKDALDEKRADNHVADLIDNMEAAVARVELANKEGDPILSAWLPSAKASIADAKSAESRLKKMVAERDALLNALIRARPHICVGYSAIQRYEITKIVDAAFAMVAPSDRTKVRNYSAQNRCSACGEECEKVLGCPSGAEVCQACFDGGAK